MQPTFPNTNRSTKITALLCSLPAYLPLLLSSLPLSYLSNSTSFPTSLSSFQAISELPHVNPTPVLIFLPLSFRLCALFCYSPSYFSPLLSFTCSAFHPQSILMVILQRGFKISINKKCGYWTRVFHTAQYLLSHSAKPLQAPWAGAFYLVYLYSIKYSPGARQIIKQLCILKEQDNTVIMIISICSNFFPDGSQSTLYHLPINSTKWSIYIGIISPTNNGIMPAMP